MLRYKVVSQKMVQHSPNGEPRYEYRYILRDEVREHDIGTCRTQADAANICSAMNFYNDWILVESESNVNKVFNDTSDPLVNLVLVENDSIDCEQENPFDEKENGNE